MVTLLSSKTGLRKGMQEAVAIRDRLTLELLATLVAVQPHPPGAQLWAHSGQAFRERFRAYLRFFRVLHLEFKPYSLRRGGATFLLQQGVPLDTILVRGRWRSLAVARLYLQDGMAQIPQLRISTEDKEKVLRYSQQCPSTAFWP